MWKFAGICASLALIVLGGQQLYRTVCDNRAPVVAFLNSDTLTCAAFYEDTFIDGYPFQCFYFPTTTVIFPDFAIYCVARIITGATGPAMVVSVCILFALELSGCYFIMRLLTPPERRGPQTIMLLGMGSVLLLVNAQSGLLNPFFRLPLILTYHGGSFVCVLYGMALVLFLSKAEKWQRRHLLALTALFIDSALGMASDRSILMHLIVPILGALLVTRIVAGGSQEGVPLYRVLLLAATMATGAFCGQLLLRLFLTPWQDVITNYPYTFENMWKSFELLQSKFRFRLKNKDKLHWLTVIWVVATALVLGVVLIRRLWAWKALSLSPYQRGWFIFAAYYFAMTITCLGAVCYSGILYNPPYVVDFAWGGGARYFLPVLFMPLLLAGLWFVPLSGRFGRAAANVVAFGVIVLAASIFRQSVNVPHSEDRSVWNYYPPVVARVDAIAEEYNLQFGLASYWEAKLITLFSRRGLRVHQVIANGIANSKMSTFHWLCNSRCYFDAPRGMNGPPRYQFILVNEQLGLPTASREQLTERFGPPAAEVPCELYYHVFVYNRPKDTQFQNIADTEGYFLRSRYQCQLGESIRFDASALPGEIFGPYPPEERTALEGCTPAGPMNYGPWLHLVETGKYRVKIVTSSPEKEASAGRWEMLLVHGRNHWSSVVAEGDVPAGETQEVIQDVTISSHRRGRLLECRVHYSGTGTLQLHYIEVTRIE